MGVDLKLFVANPGFNDARQQGYVHSYLEVGKNYDLYHVIDGSSKTWRLSENSDFHGHIGCNEPGYGRITTTPYGEMLTFISAKDLIDCIKKLRPEQTYQSLIAALAYLEKLEPHRQIGLYFH